MDSKSMVLRLLRRLCAAAPGGAWKADFVDFLWRLWCRIQAGKNWQGAATAPVAGARPLVGNAEAALVGNEDDDDGYSSCKTQVREEDDDDSSRKTQPTHGDDDDAGRKKEDAFGIQPFTPTAGQGAGTKNLTDDDGVSEDAGKKELLQDSALAGPAAIGIDFMGENADPPALGVDSKGENADLAGQPALRIDSTGTSTDFAGVAAFGIDSTGKNAYVAGPAELGKDDVGKKECAPPAAGTKDNAARKKEPAPPARSVRRATRSVRRAARALRPAPATPVLDDLQEDDSFLEPEVDECKSMHLRYRAACSSLGGKSIYCLACFIKDEQDPAKLPNDIHKVVKHMKRFHKSSTYPYRCSKKGCYAMATNAQDIAHHEQYAHGL